MARLPWLEPVALAALIAVLAADTLRVAFFADDFHMLDVARRIPLGELIGGRHGIFPWYRPLSRELYFALITHAGGLERVAARLLSLAAVALVAWQIRGIARHMGRRREGTIAMLLFLGYATTRFLAAWSSGFQDLLALALTLLAVREQANGRTGAAVAWAVLATFAKETAGLAFPLLAAQVLLLRSGPGRWRAWLAQGGGLALALLVHAAVRASWHGGGRQAEIERSWSALASALGRVAVGFVPAAGGAEPVAVVLGAVAAAVAALLLARSNAAVASDTAPARGPGARDPSTLFLVLAAALGLSPLVLGHAAGVVTASEYYAFSAAPWLALLLARGVARLPASLATAVVPFVIGANTMTLGFRVPDLSRSEAWQFSDWNWAEALRLSAVSERLSGDLRELLVNRPDSLVVLFQEMPRGCFFQSEDGPATRESLRDPTVRSYWVNAPPFGIEPGRFAVLSLDPVLWHLRRASFSRADRARLAGSSVAAGEAAAAWVFALNGDPAENVEFDFAYYRFASALIAEGPQRARRELQASGLADSTGAGPERWAAMATTATGPLRAPLVAMLRRPLDPRAHLALADASGDVNVVFEAVELRVATVLDPSLLDARLRLARSLLQRGKPAAARRDLAALVRGSPGTEVARAAAALLDSADHATLPRAAAVRARPARVP